MLPRNDGDSVPEGPARVDGIDGRLAPRDDSLQPPGLELARRNAFPAAPHATELMRGAEAGHLGNAFERERTLAQQLAGQPHAQALHVVERRALSMLCEEAREVARARVRDLRQTRGGPMRRGVAADRVLH